MESVIKDGFTYLILASSLVSGLTNYGAYLARFRGHCGSMVGFNPEEIMHAIREIDICRLPSIFI